MPFPSDSVDRIRIDNAVEASISIGLAIFLVASCLLILRPFVSLVAWGIIIAVSLYPGFQKLQALLQGRAGLASLVCTVVLLAVLILPVILLAQSLIDGVQNVASHVKDGTFTVPPPPVSVAQWPIIGPPLHNLWETASLSFTDVLKKFAPQIKAALPGVLAATVGIGFTVLQFVLAILISGALLPMPRPATKSRARYSIVSSATKDLNSSSLSAPPFAASPPAFSASRSFNPHSRASAFWWWDYPARASGR